MSKSSTSFARAPARFKPQPRVLILCEDTKSSLDYLVDAAHHFRSYAQVRIAHCGKTDPEGIVDEAVNKRGNFDKIFCVIDRDNHETFDAAVDRPQSFHPDIELVPSYPCYEFWLLLHFRFTRGPVNSVGTQSAGARMASELRAQPTMDKDDKGSTSSIFKQLFDRLPVARSNAARALAAAFTDAEMNPSTRMHLLIDEMERLGSPILLDGAGSAV